MYPSSENNGSIAELSTDYGLLPEGKLGTEEPSAVCIFISHASTDRELAGKLVDELEKNGIRCWIAPRNILVGQDYAEAIINAIDGCVALILILTAQSNASSQVKREVERAASKDKILIMLKHCDCEPNKTLEYFMSSSHWLVFNMGEIVSKLCSIAQDVAKRITELPDKSVSEPAGSLDAGEQAATPSISDSLRMGAFTIQLAYDDDNRIRDIGHAIAHDMRRRGFSHTQALRTQVVLGELVGNVRHSGDREAQVHVHYIRMLDGLSEKLRLTVADCGSGVDIRAQLVEQRQAFEDGVRMHGLLLSWLYGDLLDSSSDSEHSIVWEIRQPSGLPASVFDNTPIGSVSFCYNATHLKVVEDQYLWDRFRPSSPAVCHRIEDVILDPLLRCSGPIGVELTGLSRTLEPIRDDDVLATVLAFQLRNAPDRGLVVFAALDNGGDQINMRSTCNDPHRLAQMYPFGDLEGVIPPKIPFFENRESLLGYISHFAKTSM